MTDLPLTKLSETASTITLGWEPVVGAAGYVFYADLKRSSTLDGTRSSVRFAKGAAVYRVVALREAAEGVYWPPVTPPPVVSSIPNDVGPWATQNRWSDTDWRPDSGAIVAQLAAKANQMIVTVGKYGMSVVTAKASDPLTSYVKGGSKYGPGPLTYSFRCPVAANSDEGSDGHFAVIQPDGLIVEMYNARRLANGTYTCTGSGITTVSDFTYARSACLGSSFTISAGAILPSEVKAGRIPHALAAMFPSSCVKPGHVWPSNDDDGELASGMTQEGMRFVLDPAASLAGMTGLTLVVARALQDYGMIVTDKTTGTDIDLRGLSSASFTTVGQPNEWAALGITTDYPSVASILPLIPKMKVVQT